MAVAASPAATIAATTRHRRLWVRKNSAPAAHQAGSQLAVARMLPPHVSATATLQLAGQNPAVLPARPVARPPSSPSTNGSLLIIPIQLWASLYISGWCLFQGLCEGSNHQRLSATDRGWQGRQRAHPQNEQAARQGYMDTGGKVIGWVSRGPVAAPMRQQIKLARGGGRWVVKGEGWSIGIQIWPERKQGRRDNRRQRRRT
jgi:hypothetical protein